MFVTRSALKLHRIKKIAVPGLAPGLRPYSGCNPLRAFVRKILYGLALSTSHVVACGSLRGQATTPAPNFLPSYRRGRLDMNEHFLTLGQMSYLDDFRMADQAGI